MRLRIIDVHGSPEEIGALPQLAEMLGTRNKHLGQDAVLTPSGNVAPGAPVPEDVATLLSLRPPAVAVRHLVDRFLVETLSWPDVEARVGTSRRSRDGMANALRLHSRGSSVGAFVYLRLPSSTMLLRLPSNREGKYTYATPRQVGPDAPYGVAVRLSSHDSLTEALELARTAYEMTRVTSTQGLASAVTQDTNRLRQADLANTANASQSVSAAGRTKRSSSNGSP